jgi:uncharacterized protein with FMN-binding domain
MKRISYWILSSISTIVLLVGFDASRHGGSVTASSPPAAISSGTSSTTSGSGGASGTSSSGTSSSGGNAGSSGGNAGSSGGNASSSKTTTVTGSVVQTQWGPVQVQITVRGGTITAVKVLQYPSGNPRDVEIANYALPILIKETTQNQSAQIDMVSGATFTSDGYVQSLQSALDQAGL